MPVCDGFQATKKIRELEKKLNRHKHTPIVAMTAHAMSGDGDRCIASGMDFYISKPLNAKKLQELIQVVGAQGQYTVSSIWYVLKCCLYVQTHLYLSTLKMYSLVWSYRPFWPLKRH